MRKIIYVTEKKLDVKCLASFQIETKADVFYSAGNFVFDELKPLQTHSNAIIELYVKIASQAEIWGQTSGRCCGSRS